VNSCLVNRLHGFTHILWRCEGADDIAGFGTGKSVNHLHRFRGIPVIVRRGKQNRPEVR